MSAKVITFTISTLVEMYLFLNIFLVILQDVNAMYILKNIQRFIHYKLELE